MAKRRIHAETTGNRTVKVFRDLESREYIVRLYVDGVLYSPADYFTGDRQDAIETAGAMCRPIVPRAPRPLALEPSVARTPLSVPFNVAVLHIANRILPCGFDVSDIAPQSFDSLMAHYDKTGRILVWNGASDKTIFADAEVNYAFRAWHDSRHIIGGFPFTREGEMAAMIAQCKDVMAIYSGETAALFCNLVQAEIKGQFDYKERRGGFPIDQFGFVRAYLADADAAIAGDYGVTAEAA